MGMRIVLNPRPIPTLDWDFLDLNWTGLDLGLGT